MVFEKLKENKKTNISSALSKDTNSLPNSFTGSNAFVLGMIGCCVTSSFYLSSDNE